MTIHIHTIPSEDPEPAKAGEGLIPMPRDGVYSIDMPGMNVIVSRKNFLILKQCGFVTYGYRHQDTLMPDLAKDE